MSAFGSPSNFANSYNRTFKRPYRKKRNYKRRKKRYYKKNKFDVRVQKSLQKLAENKIHEFDTSFNVDYDSDNYSITNIAEGSGKEERQGLQINLTHFQLWGYIEWNYATVQKQRVQMLLVKYQGPTSVTAGDIYEEISTNLVLVGPKNLDPVTNYTIIKKWDFYGNNMENTSIIEVPFKRSIKLNNKITYSSGLGNSQQNNIKLFILSDQAPSATYSPKVYIYGRLRFTDL